MKETMCNYLTKRASTYYFRRKTPLDLIEQYGKEIIFSLRTKDRTEAVKLCRKEAVKFDHEFDAHRANKNNQPTHNHSEETLTQPQPQAAGLDFNSRVEAKLGQLRSKRREANIEGKVKEWLSITRSSLDMFKEQLRTGEHPLIEDNKYDLLHVEAYVIAAEHLLDDKPLPYLNTLNSPPAPTSHPTSNEGKISTASTQGKASFESVIQAWAKERQPRARTVAHMRRVANLLSDLVGKSHMDMIAKSDVITFKNHLLEDDNSAANINIYLSLLRTLFNYAIGEDLLSSNPALGIKVTSTSSAKNARLPFDGTALNKIFTSPVYTNHARPLGGKGEAAYWIPLIALFTGARLEEIAQLRTEDIQNRTFRNSSDIETSCWVIHITDEAEGQRLKNTSSRRIVPIHKTLQDLGLVTYVQQHTGFIFPDLLPTKQFGVRSGNWSKWFSKYLRKEIGITDSKLVFHSFRHTFKELCRNCSIPTEVHHALTGHSMGNVGDNYGSQYFPLPPLADAVAKYKVPGIDATFFTSIII